MTGLNWGWIAVMAALPLPAALLAAAPIWRRQEIILGNLAGTGVIFGTALALILRESAELDVVRQQCFDAGFTVCAASPTLFTRHAIYASIGLAQVVVLFLLSLRVERRARDRRYAPEWRR